MPAWSPEIANDFLRLAWPEGVGLDQRQLQQLVYLAHGWCLAASGEPLTGDRPIMGQFGPEYALLSNSLLVYGIDPIRDPIRNDAVYANAFGVDQSAPACSKLDPFERDVVRAIFHTYGRDSASQLSAITRGPGSPWHVMNNTDPIPGSTLPDSLLVSHFQVHADEPLP